MSKENLEATLRRVRGLIARAEYQSAKADDPSTPPEEAAVCRAEANACETQADALMLKYRIDEIGEAPEAASLKPMISTVVIGDSEITGFVNYLMSDIAKHCRCKVRSYTSWTNEGWNAKVYGFESDVRYFEMMYTSIRLHMLGILLPKINRDQSLEDNCYRLHNSGYNWLQIADMYGWKKYNSQYWGEYGGTTPPSGMKVPFWRQDEGWHPSTYVGGIYKRAYLKAVKARGEAGQKIAANGTETYRKSAADGYISMIHYRLRQMEKERDSGAALILASTADAVDKLFREDNPDLFVEVKVDPDAKQTKVRMRKAPPLRYNADAYRRGAAHARNADLNGNARTGSASRTEIHG